MEKNINWAATDLVKWSIFHASKLCEGVGSGGMGGGFGGATLLSFWGS